MKALLTLLLVMLVGCSSPSVKVAVTNPTDAARLGEMVEVEVAALGLEQGAGLVVTETCLPIKIYVGHILNLIKKGVKNR